MSVNTKMASATATTMMSSPGTHAAPPNSTRLADSSNNSAKKSLDSRNPDIVSASAAVELKNPNRLSGKISLHENINSFTPILRKISFLIATITTALAAPLCMIFGEKNPIRKLIEGLATQSVNLSLGWVAGITGVLDQVRRKDLPMVLIQLGDSLATLLSPLANKTMNRGVWIGGMNIANFLKKYIDEKPDFTSFGESISWTGTALMRYLDELRSKGLKAIFTDHKSTAFGITTSMFTILGSVIYFITGDKNFAPMVRHAGGGFSEIQKFSGDNLESGRTQLVNAGVSMLGSSILDAGGKFVSQFNPALGQAMNYGSQALNNFGRGNQLESQRINELGHSYQPVSFTGALSQGFTNFFDLKSLFTYFNKETIPVMEMKSNGNSQQNSSVKTATNSAQTTARPKASGFHSSNGVYGGGFGRTTARPSAYSGTSAEAKKGASINRSGTSIELKPNEASKPSNDLSYKTAQHYIDGTPIKQQRHSLDSWNKIHSYSNSNQVTNSGSQVSSGSAQPSTATGSGSQVGNTSAQSTSSGSEAQATNTRNNNIESSARSDSRVYAIPQANNSSSSKYSIPKAPLSSSNNSNTSTESNVA